MRPRKFIQAPRPSRGPSGASTAAPTPKFRWTFKTWIVKTIQRWSGSETVHTQDECTMTVIASTEDAAKSKIIAALPPLPRDEEPWQDLGYKSATYERHWLLDATVEEVA